MCVFHLIIFHRGHDDLLNSPLHVHLCVHVFSDTSYATHPPVCARVCACACSASPRGAALCLPLQFEGSRLIRCLCVLTRWYISSQQHGSLSLHSCWANKPDLCTTPTATPWSDSYYKWLQRAMIWSTFKQQFARSWKDAPSFGSDMCCCGRGALTKHTDWLGLNNTIVLTFSTPLHIYARLDFPVLRGS